MLIHEPVSGMKAMKYCCAACTRTEVPMSKEHFWPEWLLRATNAKNDTVKWFNDKYVNPAKATVPLCVECNSAFGEQLEGPVSVIFSQINNDEGISDLDAELLVRWLWKFEGLGWLTKNPVGAYSKVYTLRDRVLKPLDQIRGNLCLAISRIDHINPESDAAPLGLDSKHGLNAIFVSGVFDRIALMVLLSDFEDLVPRAFDLYHLSDKRHTPTSEAKLFYPKIGFYDDIDAVGVTFDASDALSDVHEELAFIQQQKKDS